jgi:lipocalin-like protein
MNSAVAFTPRFRSFVFFPKFEDECRFESYRKSGTFRIPISWQHRGVRMIWPQGGSNASTDQICCHRAAQDFVGTWQLVSNTNVRQDGNKVDIFGANPKGLYVFTSNGHFAIVNMRPDLPKFASNNRNEGTAEENKAIVQGSIALFGMYSVADKVLTLKVEGSTWPSWTGNRSETKLHPVRRRAEVVAAGISRWDR